MSDINFWKTYLTRSRIFLIAELFRNRTLFHFPCYLCSPSSFISLSFWIWLLNSSFLLTYKKLWIMILQLCFFICWIAYVFLLTTYPKKIVNQRLQEDPSISFLMCFWFIDIDVLLLKDIMGLVKVQQYQCLLVFFLLLQGMLWYLGRILQQKW